jgi:diketogulonate reductase-like aldo/keto reductase
MGCDYIDLYLLHWRGSHRFADTLKGMAELVERGLVRHVGVSNLDADELSEWLDAEKTSGLRGQTQCNQLYYCLEARGIEFDLLPWQRGHRIQTMAYSPLAEGSLARHPALTHIGRERGATAAQIALAWCIREPDVVAIPKSVDPARIDENLRAAAIRLTGAELAEIDRAFPKPQSREPLATA